MAPVPRRRTWPAVVALCVLAAVLAVGLAPGLGLAEAPPPLGALAPKPTKTPRAPRPTPTATRTPTPTPTGGATATRTPAPTAGATATPVVSGTLTAWHPVTVDFAGPSARETDSAPNPFLDYRLQVAFTGPSGQVYNVPGFFDEIGRAHV
jgi:hypothetical protein